jgi:hypothetical protein
MSGGNLRERSPRKMASVSAQAKLTITEAPYRTAITSQPEWRRLREQGHRLKWPYQDRPWTVEAQELIREMDEPNQPADWFAEWGSRQFSDQ